MLNRWSTSATTGRGFTFIWFKFRILHSMFLYRLLADAVVAIHLALVGFIVIGMAAILLGIVLGWRWVRNFYFRIIHLAMIAIVVEKSVFGLSCPLTDWEDRLREMAGETVAQGTFIGRLLHGILFWNVPQSKLLIFYYLFGLAVLLAFIFAPPRWPWRRV
jgi:hypothetical protein